MVNSSDRTYAEAMTSLLQTKMDGDIHPYIYQIGVNGTVDIFIYLRPVQTIFIVLDHAHLNLT